MRTDDLIHHLSAGVEPAPPSQVPRTLLFGLACGAVITTLILASTIGIRHDLTKALLGSVFWMKFVYTAVLAALSLKLVEQLARPDATPGRLAWLPALPIAVMLLVAALQLLPADSVERHALIMGRSARVCSLLIASLAVPLFAGIFWALRQLAPTRLTEAGAAAGLLAGSAAATIYALHCPESAPTFIAIWYTAGILIPALIGAALGRWLLRW